jgi:hypothetical protein
MGLASALLWKFGPATNFFTAAAMGAAETLFYLYTIRRVRRG